MTIWIKPSEVPPNPSTLYIVDIGKNNPIRAEWIAKYTTECGMGADDDFYDYDEATDTYHLPEGWYETNQYEETHWFVHDEVLHYAEMPMQPGRTV